VKEVKRDRNLQHQIVLENLNGNTGFPTVTCNCRKRAGLEPMGRNQDLQDAAVMYNDPENHIEPFGEDWEVRINGQRSQGV
jgi:hypothetical protein